MNDVFELASPNNLKTRTSCPKLIYLFQKTNTGQNALSFIGPSISNKTPRGSQKKQKALILSNITLKKYYQTQFKAENKL